jgi:hypothetical protein
MGTIRNPKQEGSNLWDCIPQKGPCPMNCSQCFYNRPGAFYAGMEPLVPTPEEVGDDIVRMNCGHDSNLEKELVIETAKKYKHFFFNTSIPKFDFPGPVVFTANPKEDKAALLPSYKDGWNFDNLMFVRLRVSPTNLHFIENAVKSWTERQIPVVLTLMSYYDQTPPDCERVDELSCCRQIHAGWNSFSREVIYTWRVRHVNSYWCPTKEFMNYILDRMKQIGGRLVTICGTPDSNYCRDCRNCEHFYFLTLRHLQEVG